MIRSLEGSLTRLKRDCIDDFMIHEPLLHLPTYLLDEMSEVADRLKDQGKIRRWGICGSSDFIGDFINDLRLDSIQAPLLNLIKMDNSFSKRKIGYGAYKMYSLLNPNPDYSFPSFVRNKIESHGIDLIVSTKKLQTLYSFQKIFT